MKYFFIFGNNPTLSLAELASVLQFKPPEVLLLSAEALIIDINTEINAQELIRTLGGTIKIGVINFQFPIFNFQKIFNESIVKLVDSIKSSGKFNFGISYYGAENFKQEKSLAMEIKKILKEKHIRSRWVTSKEKRLSSVVVEQNKLTTDKGLELVIIQDNKKYYLGKTFAVQPFKELSRRDYGRPGRDDYSGMLPPKLAQIMINLAVNNTDKHGFSIDVHRSQIALLDPFCGSGTVLTEAMLMGHQSITGCDQSAKAVVDTKKNIEWIKEQYLISNIKYQIFECDVRQLVKKVPLNSIDVIVTEPYLGPARRQRDRRSITKIIQELEILYNQAITEFEKVLKPNGKVVMIWPVLALADKQKIYLNSHRIMSNSSLKIINPFADFNNKVLQLTNRQTLLYGRPNQRVWREIFVLKK